MGISLIFVFRRAKREKNSEKLFKQKAKEGNEQRGSYPFL